MSAQARFNIFFDENQASLLDDRKQVTLDFLPGENQKIVGVLRPLSNLVDCELKKPFRENAFLKPDCIKQIDKQDEALQEYRACIVKKSLSPAPSISPMLVSPIPELKTQTSWVSPKKYVQLYDDKFFTDLYNDSHYAHLKRMETKIKARYDYMLKQRDISIEMRSILVDWLVEVNEEYHQSDETLFLTVSLVDRFLSMMSVVRTKLQLVGTAAMLVAAKVEEIYPPLVSDLVYITDDTYTPTQIIRMEALLLKNIEFEVGDAHTLKFVKLLAVKLQVSVPVAHMAQYLCEISLLYIDTLLHKQSELAIASLLLAMFQVEGEVNDYARQAVNVLAVDVYHTQTAICFLQALVVQSSLSNFRHKAIPIKYSNEKYSSVAQLPLKLVVPHISVLLKTPCPFSM